MTADRRRDALLWTSVLVAMCGVVATMRSGGFAGHGDSWTLGVAAIGCCALGWLVASRQPDLPIGWLLLAGGAVQAWSFLANWWAHYGLRTDPGSLPLASLAAWLALWLSPLPFLLVLVAPLVLFPAGRARSRRWWWFLTVTAAVMAALVAAAAIVAIPVAIDRPLALVDGPNRVARHGAAALAVSLRNAGRRVGLGATVVALVGVAVAWRQSRGLARRQYAIVLIGVSVVITNAVVGAAVPALTDRRLDGPDGLAAAAVLTIATALAIAVIRYRLYDLDVLVSRSVLAVLVGVVLAVVYSAVLLGLAVALGDDSNTLSVPGVAAAGAVVIATAPAMSGATHMTRRWFGRGIDSTTVTARLSDTDHAGDDGAMVLERFAEAVRRELRLGSVEIAVDGSAAVHTGTPGGRVTTVPLDYQGRHVGELIVTARPGERLSEPDRRTLTQVAHYLGVTAEAVRASDDLRMAQEALERARLEERRRVRLDLHDGLGPALASIHLRLLTLRRRLPADPDVDDIVDQTADTIREVRRIVEGLQPSVLDDLGLVPAVQILAADTRSASGIEVAVTAGPGFDDVPAHLAAATYRVVAEGLSNVVRHSRGRSCSIDLRRIDGAVVIAICDDGCGFDPATPAGMGLRSIGERARAIGGEVSVTSAVGIGTTVAVRLPA